MEYVKIGKKEFRYNRDHAIVEYVCKATPDMYADDAEWMEKFNRPLWGIDKDGYVVLDSAGLSREHWDDKESRIEYLTSWGYDIDSETNYLVEEFVKYEMGGVAV